NFVSVFQGLYLGLSFIGLGLIAFNYFGFGFEKFIVFIVSRILFVLSTTFLASYYRLTSRPEKVLYISIFSNAMSLSFLILFFLKEYAFSLWLIFIGQILFSVFYFLKSFRNTCKSLLNSENFYKNNNLVLRAFLFSWPTILQAFIMMYMTNYGKINALGKMTVDDGVLLSLMQRISMIIFLTHSSLWAYLIKDIYVGGEVCEINKNILHKYLSFLIIALIMAIFIASFYLFSIDEVNLD